MTRAEIEKEVLKLPERERVALLHSVVETLRGEMGTALREELEAFASANEQALSDRLEALMGRWFEGPSEEMTEGEWAALKRGDYKHPPEKESWAAPPGWKSPRLSSG